MTDENFFSWFAYNHITNLDTSIFYAIMIIWLTSEVHMTIQHAIKNGHGGNGHSDTAIVLQSIATHKITLVLPSRTKHGLEFSAVERTQMRRWAGKHFANLFGGYTMQSGNGGWLDHKKNLVSENVDIIFAYGDFSDGFRATQTWRKLKAIALGLKVVAEQEAVLLAVEPITGVYLF